MSKPKRITNGLKGYKVIGKGIKNKLLEADFAEFPNNWDAKVIDVFFKPNFLSITNRWEAKRTKRNLKQLISFIDKHKKKLADV